MRATNSLIEIKLEIGQMKTFVLLMTYKYCTATTRMKKTTTSMFDPTCAYTHLSQALLIPYEGKKTK